MQTILKRQFVQVDAQDAASSPARARAGARTCEKQIELLRVDDVVHALEITCSCGEKTVVELEYAKNKE